MASFDEDENINFESIAASVHDAPIVSSYNDQVRPLLDAVDKLRHLKIMQEGIKLPTIVVVGDQSSGKSSVLESLAGISLPTAKGICTRVPLIMRLRNHSSTQPELLLEYEGRVVRTDEKHIAAEIILATEKIAGKGRGISDNPLTLTISKKGVPDLTLIDLPGITRVQMLGQPKDICKQISDIMNDYIQPEESIILNVLSATIDVSTCESIRMSQLVDSTWQRTLAVVTKVDTSPENLLEKVTTDFGDLGLEYVCVRNRVGDESYEEARAEEAKLFETHPLLSKIDKSTAGVPALAERLMKLQYGIIVKSLPDIVGKIDSKISGNKEALNKLPKPFNSEDEAKEALMNILFQIGYSLKRILVEGDYDEFLDETEMHCTSRLTEMLRKYYEELQSAQADPQKKFLDDEIKVLDVGKEIRLPNFIPKGVFRTLHQKNVRAISSIPVDFVGKIWRYLEKVVISVLQLHSNYPELSSSLIKAAQNFIAKKKQRSLDWVKELIEMERLNDYTCSRGYLASYNNLMSYQSDFLKCLEGKGKKIVTIGEFGSVDVSHLRGLNENIVKEAFDLKMRMRAYWDIVLTRMVDNMAMHLRFSIETLVTKELSNKLRGEIIGSDGDKRGVKRMLGETPSISEKRMKLEKSIDLLQESKDMVAEIMYK